MYGGFFCLAGQDGCLGHQARQRREREYLRVSERRGVWRLASGVRRKEPLFARVTRGRYVLISRSA